MLMATGKGMGWEDLEGMSFEGAGGFLGRGGDSRLG